MSATSPPCPKCKKTLLSRDRQKNPPVFSCPSCLGLWLMPGEADILKASSLSSSSSSSSAATFAPAPRAPHDKVGGFCPFGHGLLARARVTLDDGGADFYLERCNACAGVFFDDGEWARLMRSPMFEHLDDLFDPHFQQQLAEEKSHERWRDELVQRLSADVVDTLDTLAAALTAPRDDGSVDDGLVSDAIAYLTERIQRHHESSPTGPRRVRKVDAVLLHVLPARERLEGYVPPSLASEGFVHLCHRDQLTGVLTRHFTDAATRARVDDLNVLVLDPARLLHPIKDEAAGDHGVFPHLYGPLPLEAVRKVVSVPKEMGLDEVLRRVDDAIES